VIYPWLESHPQHGLALKQMYGGGTVVTFEVVGGKDEAFAVMNALQIVDISNNLGGCQVDDHPPCHDHPPAAGATGPSGGRDHRRGLRVSVALRTSVIWSRTSNAPWADRKTPSASEAAII